MNLRVLFASAEALPFSKTGGLADVAFSLPAALVRLGVDLRVVTPAYRGALERLRAPRVVTRLQVRSQTFTIWEGRVEPGGWTAWLVDCPSLYARAGTPYGDEQGREHRDNAWRYACYSDATAQLALGVPGLDWQPHIAHLNDWHSGLAALWIGHQATRPALVFTIHNLAYQGLFGRDQYDALGLPAARWRPDALEFHGGFSFMKAGLLHADAITTVSPTYAREIQTPELGERLDGVLRERAAILCGILNGIDAETWNPAIDVHLPTRYDATTVVAGKRANKLALQAEMGLECNVARPLLAYVGRLAHQKGADLLLGAADWIAEHGVQLAMLGSGDKALEQAFETWSRRTPGAVGVRIGYDESLAHRIEAGADFFLMPSRYEPCGLNQMYSQRYGTVPIVRRTGGLADTVVDARAETIASGHATGIHFEHADIGGVRYGLGRALELLGQDKTWRRMQQRGMQRDFSWAEAARSYLSLYRRSITGSHRVQLP